VHQADLEPYDCPTIGKQPAECRGRPEPEGRGSDSPDRKIVKPNCSMGQTKRHFVRPGIVGTATSFDSPTEEMHELRADFGYGLGPVRDIQTVLALGAKRPRVRYRELKND
jgi:hypothetical protein